MNIKGLFTNKKWRSNALKKLSKLTGQKRAMILRWGGWGDVVMATVLLPMLKTQGYHVTAFVTKGGREVIKHDPRVDRILIHETDSIPHDELEDYWEELAKDYDKFINLSGSIEDNLLISDRSDKYRAWDKATIHKLCNKNYYEETIRWAGYNPEDWRFPYNPELFFVRSEHQWARRVRLKYRNKFIILWALSGSSLHKSYPYTEYILQRLLHEHDDIMVFFVGDHVCELLQFSHPRVKGYSGKWPIRKSLIMTEYVDLVVGPETGVLNAAAGSDVPKVVLLSHSTEENLTKHWENTHSLCSLVPCYPCHVLHFSPHTCPVDLKLKTPVCMVQLPAIMVYNAIKEEYLKWSGLTPMSQHGS